jgi:hypothetical protein
MGSRGKREPQGDDPFTMAADDARKEQVSCMGSTRRSLKRGCAFTRVDRQDTHCLCAHRLLLSPILGLLPRQPSLLNTVLGQMGNVTNADANREAQAGSRLALRPTQQREQQLQQPTATTNLSSEHRAARIFTSTLFFWLYA